MGSSFHFFQKTLRAERSARMWILFGSLCALCTGRHVLRRLAVRQAFFRRVYIGHQLIAGDGLLLQQVQRDLVKQLAVFLQELPGRLVAA